MTILGVAIGAPLGMLAGTYMAEYGRYSRLTMVVRFINDILLSAPSIVIGLFVYQVMVAQMGIFRQSRASSRSRFSSYRSSFGRRKTCCCWCRRHSARRPPRSACRAACDQKSLLQGGASGPRHRRASRDRPRQRRNRAASVHVAERPFFSANLNAPMASLPIVIFQFALSPYKDWQQLAWTGALLITLTVLALSIFARWLGTPRSLK